MPISTLGDLSGDEQARVKKMLRKQAYQLFDEGKRKRDLLGNTRLALSRILQSDFQERSNERSAGRQGQDVNIIIVNKEEDSFWNLVKWFVLWDLIFGRQRSGNVHVHVGSSGNKNKEDKSVTGDVIAVFFVVLMLSLIIIGSPYCAYRIKNAKLENNKYSVPSAIALGIFSLSLSTTLGLLLAEMITPRLQEKLGFNDRQFLAFQVFIGLYATMVLVIGLYSFHLAFNKSIQKSYVDRIVDQVIGDKIDEEVRRIHGPLVGCQFPTGACGPNSNPYNAAGTPHESKAAQHAYDSGHQIPNAPPYDDGNPPTYDEAIAGCGLATHPSTELNRAEGGIPYSQTLTAV